jgi:hypothetical protein
MTDLIVQEKFAQWQRLKKLLLVSSPISVSTRFVRTIIATGRA